jgi:hypothetical protein
MHRKAAGGKGATLPCIDPASAAGAQLDLPTNLPMGGLGEAKAAGGQHADELLQGRVACSR